MRTNVYQTIAACVVITAALVVVFAERACASEPSDPKPSKSVKSSASPASSKLETATFGSGCFWCTEAVFERLKGVKSVVSGYSGGDGPEPTYEQVSSGTSGYAEVVQITFDPAAISFADMLRVFWQTHDPTTLNRQGPDVGPQYRSAIFYHSDQQRKVAEQYKRQLDASGQFNAPIVTEITAYKNFYPAEKYHQDYFNLNPEQRYCALMIRPKIQKFQKEFKELLREGAEGTATKKK